LNEIKLDILEKKPDRGINGGEVDRYAEKPLSPQMKQNQNTVSLINTEKIEKYRAESPNYKEPH
jgi:hypothetical protein